MIKKKCPSNKIVNPKTGRCIKAKTTKTFKKIVLKKGELSKYGYSKIKTLKQGTRRKAISNAIKEYGAPKVLKKIGLIKTYQKNKNPEVSQLLMNNMKWVRKKYDKQFKSSWKISNLFK
jgi:hypothetical protein